MIKINGFITFHFGAAARWVSTGFAGNQELESSAVEHPRHLG